MYVLETEEGVTKNADISAFFLETPIQEAMKSGEDPIHVPVLQYICLYKGRIVRIVFKCPISSSISASAPHATVSSHHGRFTVVSATCPSFSALSHVVASANSITTAPGWRTAWATATTATLSGFWCHTDLPLNRSSPASCSRSSGSSPCPCTSSRTSSLCWRV